MWSSIFLAAVLSAAASSGAGLALVGNDPVALCGGTELLGSKQFELTHGRYTYRFADAENLARFRAEPEHFAIQWGGACARMGPLSGAGDPGRWAVHAGRLFIFASDGCRAGFLAAPERFVTPASVLEPFDESSQELGAAWIAKAVAAHGGSQRIAAAGSLHLVHEERSGDWDARLEHTLTATGGLERRSTYTPHVDPWEQDDHDDHGAPGAEESADSYDTTWSLGPEPFIQTADGRFDMTSPELLEDLRRLALREPLALLWARAEPDFVAVYRGAGRLGDESAELVSVLHAGLVTTLYLDPTSGRILGLGWRGRLSDGITREIRETLTEFAEVEGLLLPIDREVRTDGKLQPSLATRWTSIQVRPDAADKGATHQR